MDNYKAKSYAKECARNMRMYPSPLEEEMMNLLDKHNLNYVFQNIFYIIDYKGHIDKFFIVDFYFPEVRIVLETDGNFHHKRVKQDAKRTDLLLSHYPELKIIRWEWGDFNDQQKIKELLFLLKDASL